MLQRTVDCLSQAVFRQHRVHCVVEPGLELGEQRDSLFLPLPQPFFVTEIFDLPLYAEQLLVKRQRLVWPSRFLKRVGGFRASGYFCLLTARHAVRPSARSIPLCSSSQRRLPSAARSVFARPESRRETHEA